MTMAVPENRYQCLYMAKLAEQGQRYEDTLNFMEKLVINSAGGSELTIDERNLLSTATKNVIDSLRASWQTVSPSTEQGRRKKNDVVALLLVNDYKSKIESELSHLCARITNLLDNHLIPSASESESKVFYLKMKGDYYRYLTELKAGVAERKEALVAYKAAEEIAVAELDPTHPTRLGLALNFSVFCYEIERESEKACSMAREAIEEAMECVGNKSSYYKDTTLVVLQLLRDNLNLWASDMEINSSSSSSSSYYYY